MAASHVVLLWNPNENDDRRDMLSSVFTRGFKTSAFWQKGYTTKCFVVTSNAQLQAESTCSAVKYCQQHNKNYCT